VCAGASAVVAVLALATGCGGGSAPTTSDGNQQQGPWVPDRADLLARAVYSGFVTSTRAVVADAQTWASAWDQIWNVSPAPLPLPAVDFGTSRVLVVALGAEPSGGYDIRVDSAVTGTGTVVYVTTTAPGPTCLTTGASTAPAVLVRMPKSVEPVTFQDRNTVYNCP
jgi:hypothetical protein